MKVKTYFLLLASGMFALTSHSCDKEDGIAVSAEFQTAFSAKYPNVQRVEWEVKRGYYVADFHDNGSEAEAWFTANAVWQMTETDIAYEALPTAVKDAFKAGDYAALRIDDIDKIERREIETVYVIEVESGNQDFDLYYSPMGVLVKAVPDTDGHDDSFDYLPAELPAAVTDFINTRYPGARIIEAEREHNFIEVDIIHESKAKELLFTTDAKWISTSCDVRIADLPIAAKNAALQEHDGYVIDDVDFIETPAATYYLIELERGESEIKIKVTAEGAILS